MLLHHLSSLAAVRVKAVAVSAAIASLFTGAFTVKAERSYEAWTQRYNTTSDALTQTGTATAIDPAGNVAITGFLANELAFYTAKYDALTGALLWEDIFDASGADRANAIATDSQGNVIVTGTSTSATGLDFYTIKYNGVTGARLWERRFDGPNGGADRATAVVVGPLDTVIVAGTVTGSNDDIQVLRYTAAGTLNGQFRYTSAGTRPDTAVDLKVDSAGFAIVVGTSTVASGNADIYVAKVNLTTQAAVWTQFITSAQNFDDEGKGVAVDAQDHIIVTGVLATATNSHSFITRKYTPAGGTAWTASFVSPVEDFLGPADIAVDSAGNAVVTGSSTLDNFKTTIYTAKYASADGAVLWDVRSELPGATAGTFQEDRAVKVAIDPADNAIVTGLSQTADNDDDYYTVKYAAADGQVLWEQRRNGDNETGDDTVADLTIDKTGAVAITGRSRRATGNTFQILTIKYGRFTVATKDLAPGAGVNGTGVPAGARISAIGTPAIGDDGTVTARVTLAKGKKRLAAILAEGPGGATLPVVKGMPAPGFDGPKFQSFGDPVVAPDGTIAFTAKLSGLGKTKATGLWTTAFDGTLQNVLQQGREVPGTDATLASISSVSLRNGELVALLKLNGAKNINTVLVNIDTDATTPLLRTGQMLTIGDAPASKITSITVLSPAKGSPGHGRWQADPLAVARVELADGRLAVVRVQTAGAGTGTVTSLLVSGQEATGVASGAVWKGFGFPAVGTSGANFAVLGSLEQGEGGITEKNDTVLAFSTNGAAFSAFATESATAPGSGTAQYASFLSPVVNAQGRVAFVAGLKGDGVGKNNKSGLFFGAINSIAKIARTGETAPDASGDASTTKYDGLVSVALPSGASAGPIFVAKLTGNGVSKKNNVAAFYADNAGAVRRFLRTGDSFGRQKVAKIALLQATRGAFGASRSFNAEGAVAVLVTFTDRTSAILPLPLP